jgi:hypothetical protein
MRIEHLRFNMKFGGVAAISRRLRPGLHYANRINR